MDKNLTLLLTIGISAAIGAAFGILRSKIFASKVKTTLHYLFYIFSVLLFLLACYGAALSWGTSQMLIIMSFVSSIGLAAATWFFLVVKDIYETKELDPKVNKFTNSADRSEIKLFGGDLNFFGNTPNDMDQNAQYIALKARGFKKVSILCEESSEPITHIRYGKILADLPGAEIRFYDPGHADLSVRGRIAQVHGVDKLLMYVKVESGKYQALETDTANSNGALYTKIWNLVWSLTKKPSRSEMDGFKERFRNGR
jgi:hypothetical protein